MFHTNNYYESNIPKSAPSGQFTRRKMFNCSATQTDANSFDIQDLEKIFIDNFCFDYDSKKVYYLALNYINRFHRYINTLLISEEFSKTFQDNNVFQIADIPDYFTLFNMILNTTLWISQNELEKVGPNKPKNSVPKLYEEKNVKKRNSKKLIQDKDNTKILEKFETLTPETRLFQKPNKKPICILQNVLDVNEYEPKSTCYGNDIAISTSEMEDLNKISVTNMTQSQELISSENISEASSQQLPGDRISETLNTEHFQPLDFCEKPRYIEDSLYFENKIKYDKEYHQKIKQLTRSCFNIVSIQPDQINLIEYSQKKLGRKYNSESNSLQLKTSNKFPHSSMINVPADSNRSKVRPHTPKKVRNMFDKICQKQMENFKLQFSQGIETGNQTDPDSIILDDEQFETMSQKRKTKGRSVPKSTGQYNPYGQYGNPYYTQSSNPYSPNQDQFYQYGPQNSYNPYLDPIVVNEDNFRTTYLTKGRRYGQNYFTTDERNQGDLRIRVQDTPFVYDRSGNVGPILPGILGGWREDLQGKRRQETKEQLRDVFVETTHGSVQGFQVYLFDNPDPRSLYRPGSEFVEKQQGVSSAFLGIPYAQPPIEDGRFKPPRLHRGWQIIQAVDFGPACPQPTRYVGATLGIRDMDEDCLYLNVFTPDITQGTAQKYPVMVYIHGGDFIHGASNTFPGHIMATFYNVVVVTINYRLGALGFLSTGDVNSPGNYGILDQAMALRWIYDNAEKFNGDKNTLTLFGPGAGAASAGLLMVAPKTSSMVSKVIAQSGSAVADWAMIFDTYRVQNTSRVFGRQVGCSIESSWKLVSCLRNSRSAFEIGNAEFPPEVGLFPWAPVIEMNVSMPFYEGWYEKDWHFISESAESLIRKRSFNAGLRYMSGVTLQEAASYITSNRSLEPDFITTQEFFDQKVMELVLRYNYTLNLNGTFEAIKYMYTYWPDPHNVTMIREKYIQLLSDFLYIAPNDQIVKLLVEQDVPVYMYVLNTTIESLNLSEWRKVPHDIEHYLLCGAPFLDIEMLPSRERFRRDQWTPNDRNMSHFFMQAYTNFARYGNPTFTQILGIHFEESKHGQLKYLNLNTTYNSSIMWNFRQTESAFWTQYIPKVVGHLVPTYPPTTEFWWEPRAPLQIAFWSISGFCLLLIVLLVTCCMLWRNAKRSQDKYYSPYLYPSDAEIINGGIDNKPVEEVEFLEKYASKVAPARTSSAASFQTVSLKEMPGYVSSSPMGEPVKKSGLSTSTKSKTPSIPEGVPQTDV